MNNNIIILYYKKTSFRDNNKLFYILSKKIMSGFARIIFYIECVWLTDCLDHLYSFMYIIEVFKY